MLCLLDRGTFVAVELSTKSFCNGLSCEGAAGPIYIGVSPTEGAALMCSSILCSSGQPGACLCPHTYIGRCIILAIWYRLQGGAIRCYMGSHTLSESAFYYRCQLSTVDRVGDASDALACRVQPHAQLILLAAIPRMASRAAVDSRSCAPFCAMALLVRRTAICVHQVPPVDAQCAIAREQQMRLYCSIDLAPAWEVAQLLPAPGCPLVVALRNLSGVWPDTAAVIGRCLPSMSMWLWTVRMIPTAAERPCMCGSRRWLSCAHHRLVHISSKKKKTLYHQ
jgi:hypothetical protein